MRYCVLTLSVLTTVWACTGIPSAQAQLLTGFEAAPATVAREAEEGGSYISPPPAEPPGTMQERAAEYTPEQGEWFTVPLLTGLADDSMLDAPEESKERDKAETERQQPVNLQADDMMHDEGAQTVTASGNVVLEQAGRRLEADRVSYDLAQDRVIAEGNVSLADVNGDVHRAEYVELQDDLKDGVVQELRSILADGSRFTAETGVREGARKTVMESATYTPCEVCEDDPERDPLWQLRASDVIYNEEEHRIEYRNARFELLGVPVLYTPYFSHPDGTVEQKSGFLPPSGGYRSNLGLFLENSYYYALAPDKDATVGLRLHSRENPLLMGQYRQAWGEAEIQLDGGITSSERYDLRSGETIVQEEELRGHIFGAGVWDLNEKWRSGINFEYASDDQYLRQYDFSRDDVLENEIYAERFSGRNYATARVMTFQDVRIRERRTDQPEIVPEIVASFVGAPGGVPVVGGRWDLETSFLGLRREADGQDVNRFSVDGGWERRLVSDIGLLTNVTAHMRGDVYNIRDRDDAPRGSGLDRESTESRFFPQAQIETSYPLARPYENFQAVIEPLAAVTVAPHLDMDDDIPNEDSQDIQIDASNLFEPNRFPGYDEVEDQSRITYGLRTGLYGYGGSYARVFLGQSRRLEDEDNPFPKGSGLDSRESDIVGEVSTNYRGMLITNYKFQFDQDNFGSQKHEADFYGDFGDLTLGTRYLFAKALEGTDIDESREQAQAGARYALDENWRVRGGAIYDFGEESGLRETYVGVDFLGQCLSWSLTGERSLTDDASGRSSSEIMFRIGLKNLGDFETSGFEDYLDDELRP